MIAYSRSDNNDTQNSLRQFLSRVLFGGGSFTQDARLLYIILLGLMLAVTLMKSLDLILLPEHAIRWLAIVTSVDGLCLFLLGMNQRGRTKTAGMMLVLALLVMITICAATAGGILSPAATYYLTTVFIAGLLLGEAWGILTAVLCCFAGLFLVGFEHTVVLPPDELRHSAIALWLGIVLNMAIIIGLQYLAARTSRKALVQVKAELAERLRAEDALRESEQRYREVFENTSDGIFLMDVAREGRFKVVRCNPAQEKALGLKPGQATGRLVNEFLPKSVATAMSANFQRCVEAGVPMAYEEALDLPVGRRYFDTALIPVRDAAGRIYRLVGIAHNITERKQAAGRLQQTMEQLRALSTRLENLREEERTRISREIHDHLGQLLTALKLEIHSMRSRVAAVGETEIRGQLTHKIGTATELLNELIRSVQKIASELRPGVLDRLGLEAAIESEAQAFEGRTGIKCECSLPTETMDLPAEFATGVFRIVQEILTNVARHSQATEVMICLSYRAGNLVLEAEDNGVGIKESDLANDKSLGLLGMRERATLLGGTIQFRGMQREGTLVTLQLPLPKMEIAVTT